MHRAGHAQNRHVEYLDRVGDRFGDLLRFRRHPIERAMRLDVKQLHAFTFEKALQRADLIDDAIGQLFGPHLHFAPAEPLKIGQGRVRADFDVVQLRQPHRVRHDRGIRGMEAAGNVGDGDMRHQAFVITDFIQTEAFAHVAVDRDRRVSRRRHPSYPFVLIMAPAMLQRGKCGALDGRFTCVLKFDLNEGHDAGAGIDDVVLDTGTYESTIFPAASVNASDRRRGRQVPARRR